MQKLMIALVAYCVPTLSLAANMYAGVNLAASDYEQDDVVPVYSVSDIMSLGGVFGVDFDEYFSAEARLYSGIDGAESVVGNSVIKTELDRAYGVYVKGGYPIKGSGGNTMMRIYGVAGITWGELEFSNVTFPSVSPVSEKEEGLGYGLGMDINVWQEKAYINLEYMDLLSKDSFEMDLLQVGFHFRF